MRTTRLAFVTHDDAQAGQQCMRQRRRRSRGVDVRARALHHPINEALMRRHKRAAHTCGFTQGAHVDEVGRAHIQRLQNTAARIAQHAKAMRIVHHQPCAVLFAQGQQLAHRRNVAIHAEHTVCHHHLGFAGTGFEQIAQGLCIAMRVQLHTAARQANAVNQRGVVERLRKHGDVALRAIGQSAQDAKVGHVACTKIKRAG